MTDITFKDFFVAPKSKKAKKAKKVSFAQEDEGEDVEEADSNVEEDEMEMEDEATVKTSNLFDEDEDGNDDSATQHEKRMERLKAQIEQFEQENIDEKHWTLRGEINAKARPVNSLLEEDLEFDQSVKVIDCRKYIATSDKKLLTFCLSAACTCHHTGDHQCPRGDD